MAEVRATTSTPAFNGRVVHPVLAMWFEQLLDRAWILEGASTSSHIDVTLTMAPGGHRAKPPDYHVK